MLSRVLVVALLLTISLASAVLPTYQTPNQVPLSTNFELRNATSSDAEAITTILQAAFHDSPPTKYVYQFMDQHPREHHECLYQNVVQALGVSRAVFQVVVMPNITSPHNITPVAVAAWVRPSSFDSAQKPLLPLLSGLMVGSCQHRDLNMTRAIDYDHQFTVASWKYLDSVIPDENQFYLASLGTHPDYQRRGAGGALVRSGLELAKAAYADANITATLIATVAGEPLYAHLGWDSLANFSVKSLDKVDGKREKFRFDVMKYDL